MMGDPGVTLESLDWEWGDAYIICYARDQWAALRRDTHRFLTAATLDELAASIDADYAASPVPRGCDLPSTAGYLDAPGEDEGQDDAPDEDDAGGGAQGRDGDRPELLIRLRHDVPAVGHQLRAVSPGLDRPQRRRHHLPELGRAAVPRAGADRAETTPGPARPRLGLAPLGQHAPILLSV